MAKTVIRENISAPALVIAAAGTATTSGGYQNSGSLCKKERGIAMFQVLVPGAVNAVLFVEGSYDNVNFNKMRDSNGDYIYIDPSSVTGDEWWTVSADAFPAYFVRFTTWTNTYGTAGSALASGGTFVCVGLS